MTATTYLSPSSGPGLRLLLAILMVAANLRGAITCVGPLLDQIQSANGLTATAAGFLTSVPLFAFGIVSPYAATLARRIGIELAVLLSLLLVIVGLGVRYLSGPILLYVGTALIGIGIALSNVLLPGLLRRDFPQALATVTALFTMALVMAGGIGSGIAIPLANLGGWRMSMASWIVPAVIGLLVWMPRLREKSRTAAQVEPPRKIAVWNSGTAWHVSLFMATQSTAFYVIIAWLPRMLNDLEGISAAESGWILFVYQIFVLVSVMATPVFIHRLHDQRWIAVVCSTLIMAAFGGILLDTHHAMFWMIVMGLGAGGSLVLSMTLFGLRVSTAAQSVALSGMAQSIGYTMSALLPILVGYIYDHTQKWSLPLMIMLVISLAQMASGYLAGRRLTIGERVSR
jgi:CP family cyanate transporter-like MFS transporter